MPKRKNGAKSGSKGVPKRKSSESWVAYHDRLSSLAREADEAGDPGLSARLQGRAGDIARDRPDVAKRARTAKRPRSGPGTYPWEQCVKDQRAAGSDPKRADAICGRIRADSRARYPEYWAARESNPGLGNTGRAPEKPHAALALDGGPRSQDRGQPRDLLVVLDRNGTILDLCPVLGEHSLAEFDTKYPDLPIYGPLQVLASNVREIIRVAERGPCLVESRKRT